MKAFNGYEPKYQAPGGNNFEPLPVGVYVGRIYGAKAAETGRYKVFHNNNFCSGINIALNLVAHTVVFCLRTYINEWFAKLFGNKCTLCNGAGCNTCNDVGLGELVKDEVCKSQLYACAQLRE